MSGQLRTLKTRIKSVTNTKKITRAMEMVAASKLRRYQDMMSKGREYAEGIEKLLKRLNSGTGDFSHPFLEKREEKKIGFLFIASDAGLCGSYNLDLTAKAQQFLETAKEKYDAEPVICGVGKMAVANLTRLGYTCKQSFKDIRTSQIEETITGLRKFLEDIYLSGEVDSIYVIYSHFVSATSYKEVVEQLLPLERPKASAEEAAKNEEGDKYIFEPDQKTILERLIPLFFESRVRQIFLESFVSEQIARMTAMHQATENAKEMIDSLVLLRNKVRQAAITKEIIEIVSGSQAAKK